MAQEFAAPPAATTVLLVEDERGLLSLAKRVLERAGYRVVAHEAPESALAWWNEDGHGSTVDLLLTDVRMPGMTGDVLLERMRAERPDLAALLMSGNDDRLSDAAARGYAFLGKPYTPTDLVAAVRDVLTDR